ncbi:hypothetical protein DY000_02042638 [Brassica cretica]|uniref:F-box associated beta-propeller type 1 domain-containing protein n=1 Tax=Brassica cretica TaxID=69181 RepID=A0ABQ7B5W0_BRACR|nr:hypothetical protein DY000_02042638 [Brassica cretica]
MVMITDLPFDLEKKILARVPKESRPQWQTTCRRWYALSQDLLAKKHLAQTGREFILLLNTSVFSTTINLQGVHNSVDPVMEFGGKLGSLQDSNDLQIHDIFYCKGLVLCTMVGKQMLVVCSPSNCETRTPPPPLAAAAPPPTKPAASHPRSPSRRNRAPSRRNRAPSRRLLDSWLYVSGIRDAWQFLHGYWVAKKNDKQFILSFDFTRDRFGLLPLLYESVGPGDFVNYEHDDTAVLSVVSWGEFLVVDVVLLNVVSFVLDEEHKVAVCSSTGKDDPDDDSEEECTSISIIGNNIQSLVYDEGAIDGSWPHIMNYVPSPVQILRKSTRKSKRKRTTRSYEPEGSSLRKRK